MNHGPANPDLKHSPVTKSQQKETDSDCSIESKTDEKTTIITVNTGSLNQKNIGSWSPKSMSFQNNSWKMMNSSSPRKVSTPSRPVLLWEVLTTVALLMMALWMQGLPARQIPHSTQENTFPSFEMAKPEMEF